MGFAGRSIAYVFQQLLRGLVGTRPDQHASVLPAGTEFGRIDGLAAQAHPTRPATARQVLEKWLDVWRTCAGEVRYCSSSYVSIGVGQESLDLWAEGAVFLHIDGFRSH